MQWYIRHGTYLESTINFLFYTSRTPSTIKAPNLAKDIPVP